MDSNWPDIFSLSSFLAELVVCVADGLNRIFNIML